jgi:NAD(P)-dependent dehydrogenase (short-subunit alcohol dehydrogenase family)
MKAPYTRHADKIAADAGGFAALRAAARSSVRRQRPRSGAKQRCGVGAVRPAVGDRRMTRYAGRKAVVLGATGMGVAVAKRLVEGGADVLLAARDATSADAAVPEVGSSAHVVVAPPGEPAEALVAAVAARLRHVDHLVVAEEAPHAVSVLLGLIGEGGSVVLITAAAAATDRLAASLAGRGIRLNTVAPGCMDAAADAGPAPLGRRGSADEVARAALFLAVDATFTTGARLPVDGGLAQLGTDADGPGQTPR